MGTYKKPKCPRCNGCLEEKHYKGRTFWWCFLCEIRYQVSGGKVIRIENSKNRQ